MTREVIVHGQPGTGKAPLGAKIAKSAAEKGLTVECFHCPFDPEKVEHIVIPDLDTAITTSVDPHMWLGDVDTELNTDRVRDQSQQTQNAGAIAQANDTYRQLFDFAVSVLREAKGLHDELETYYVPNVHFDKIDALFDRIRARMLAYAQEAVTI